MITLNDYLYSGDTVFRILKKYSEDLKRAAEENQSEVDLLHYYFLLQIMELLEHNDFLTAQSQKIREFYQYMAKQYPYLSFTFKGRIKSLIRAEAKFNGYIVAYVYDYYLKNHAYPPVDELKERLTRFRDLIAYRIVISMPKCHVRDEREREQTNETEAGDRDSGTCRCRKNNFIRGIALHIRWNQTLWTGRSSGCVSG